MKQYKELLRQRVIKEIDLCREVGDEELYETIDRILMELSNEEYIGITEKLRLRKDIFNSIRRYDVLQELIEDISVTEIMVNGPKQIFIEKNGRISARDVQFDSSQKLEDVVQQMVKVKKYIGYF